MELAKTSSLATRDKLLSAVRPGCLGLIWAYDPNDGDSHLFTWIDFLTGGLLHRQKDYLSSDQKSYVVCRLFDQDFHLTLIPKGHRDSATLISQNLSLIPPDADQEKKTMLTLNIDRSDIKKLKGKFSRFQFKEILLT